MAKSTPIFQRHPLCLDLDAWLESEEGQRCAKAVIGGLATQFMQNRLKTAFTAGWKSGEEHTDRKYDRTLAVLRESRAAAVEQEQTSRVECNRLRQKLAKCKH